MMTMGMWNDENGEKCLTKNRKTEYYELRYEDINKNSKFFYKFEGEGLRYEIVEFVKNIREKEHGNVFLTPDDMLMESRVLQSYKEIEQKYLF